MIRTGLSVLAGLTLLAACSSSGIRLPDVVQEANATLDRFDFFPGDVLDVRFRQKPDWNHKARVRADGRVSFYLLGEIPIATLGVEELRLQLSQRYAELLNTEPGLSLLIEEFGPREVFVMGEVTDPGAYPLPRQAETIFEALARAGGPLKRTAELEEVLLVRRVPPTEGETDEDAPSGSPVALRVWKIDLDHDYWITGTALMVQPGDVIFIPNTTIDDVDIWVDQYIRQLIPLPNFNYY